MISKAVPIAFLLVVSTVVGQDFNLLEALKKEPQSLPPRDLEEPTKPPLETSFNLVGGDRTPEVKAEEETTVQKLDERSYFNAYSKSQALNEPLAVFIVRKDDQKLIVAVNRALKAFEKLGFDKYLAIAVVGNKNPNADRFPVRHPEIEAVGWSRKNGIWTEANYEGMTEVTWLINRLISYLEAKATVR